MAEARGTVNVSIWQPGHGVPTMLDEIGDGTVYAAVQAAISAYRPVDSDQDIPVFEYESDFDDAVAAAMSYSGSTVGPDLMVIITDLASDNRERAEDLLLHGLAENNDFVVIVPVSNQGYDEAWASKLDGDTGAESDRVDVVNVDELGNPDAAMREVGPWASNAA